jgi:hypothetical protein
MEKDFFATNFSIPVKLYALSPIMPRSNVMMERVTSLKGGTYRIQDSLEGRIWMDGPVTIASGIKEAYEAKLKSMRSK